MSAGESARAASLRGRLIAGAALWVLGAVAAAGAVSSELLHRQHLGGYRDALGRELERIGGTLRPTSSGGLETSWRAADAPLPGLAWALLGEAGERLLVRGENATLPTLRDGELRLFDEPPGVDRAALATSWSPPGAARSFTLVAAARLANLDGGHLTRHRVWTTVLGLAGVLLLGTGVLVLSRGLRPLVELEKRLAEVRRGEARRLEGRFPREVVGVVSELNALLERAERSVAEARADAAALAHALKTPLAVVAGEVERLEEAGHAALARRLDEPLGRLRAQVEERLARARTAERARDPGARCDARAVVEHLVETMRKLHGKTIVLRAPDSLPVRCDRTDLEEIAGNLIDNACKWCRDEVLVALEGGADGVSLTVDDDGPGLDPARRARVFDPGRRYDASTPGSGFGLAIVRDLAEAWGAAVELDAAEAGGLRVRVTLRPGGS